MLACDLYWNSLLELSRGPQIGSFRPGRIRGSAPNRARMDARLRIAPHFPVRFPDADARALRRLGEEVAALLALVWVGVLLSARRRERRRRRRSGATGAGWLDAGKERSHGRVGSASRSVVWGRPTETTTGGGDLGPIIALVLVACEEPLRPRRLRVLGQGHGTHARAPPPPAGRLARNWAARPTAGVTRGE